MCVTVFKFIFKLGNKSLLFKKNYGILSTVLVCILTLCYYMAQHKNLYVARQIKIKGGLYPQKILTAPQHIVSSFIF